MIKKSIGTIAILFVLCVCLLCGCQMFSEETPSLQPPVRETKVLSETDNFIRYEQLQFSSGTAKTLMVIGSAASETTLEIRIDAADGPLVGTLSLPASDEAPDFTEHYAAIQSVSGVHDLYLVALTSSPVQVDVLALSEYDGSETAEEKNQRMAWWRAARYGQFIHLGAYANYPFSTSYQDYSEWVMSRKQIDPDTYERACVADFNPENWDASKIVADAAAAGAQYIVFTAKHHEGFSMYDTDVAAFQPYSLMDYGNYTGDDPVGSLAAECEKAGIPFGCYYSIMDWHHPAQSQWGNAITDKAQYTADMKAQLYELIVNYDIDVLWFDGEWVNWWTAEDGQELYRFARTLKPSLVINNRVGKRQIEDGDFGTPEQVIPATGLDYDWESCITMNRSWGYLAHDTSWKSPEWIVKSLISTASKGGNLLLNVGPDSLGVVPEECIARLAEAGSWITANGESIFGTTASPFSEPLKFGAATKKDGKLYLFVTDWPKDNVLTIPVIENQIHRIALLHGDALSYTIENDMIHIQLPDTNAGIYPSVVEISTNGLPTVSR